MSKCLVVIIVPLSFLLHASVLASSLATSQGEGRGATRAEACIAATRSAEAGKYGFLEQTGRIARVEKRCDCEKDETNGRRVQWSCLASIGFEEKK